MKLNRTSFILGLIIGANITLFGILIYYKGGFS